MRSLQARAASGGTIKSCDSCGLSHGWQYCAVIDSRGPVRATLEVAAGTAERLDIRVGDKVLQRIFTAAP